MECAVVWRYLCRHIEKLRGLQAENGRTVLLPTDGDTYTMNSSSLRLSVALAVAVLSPLAGGAWFYRAQERRMRQDAEKQLQAIVQLKSSQLAEWRTNRLADASMLVESPFFREGVSLWTANPNDENADRIFAALRPLKQHRGYYDILLLDAEGRMRLSLSGRPGPPPEEEGPFLAAALRDRKPAISKLHPGRGDLGPYMEVVAPLFIQDGESSKAIGAVIFQCEARKSLYPLVDYWPIPSLTAETQLIRRDEGVALLLNDLRHQPDTALKLRIPLDREDAPSVMAALGRDGVVKGRDYRGVEVLSAIIAIPDSPWFLVAKVDAAEVFTAWRFQSFLILAVTLAAAAAPVAVVLVVWHRNAKVHYWAMYHAETERRRSEQQHGITLRSIGDGVIVTDAEGRVKLLNRMAETLTGWSAEEAHGKPLEDVFRIVNEDSRQPVDNPVHRVMREVAVVGLANHTLLLARDGTERPISDSGAPIRDERGEVTGAVLVFHDQSTERAFERSLRQSEANFRNIYENSPFGIALFDHAGFLIDANRSCLDIFGLRDISVVKGFHMFGGISLSDEHKKMLLRGENVRQEIPLDFDKVKATNLYETTRSGIRHLDMLITCLGHEASERAVAFLVHVRDITDRNRAEAALQESEQKYHILFQAAPEGILVVDPVTRGISYVNPAICNLFGYSKDELIQMHVTHIHPPEETHLVLKDFEQLASEEWLGRDVVCRRKDGSTFIAHISATQIFMDGRAQCMGFLSDITDRKQAQDALERLNVDLEHRVRERTSQLAESERRYRTLVTASSEVIYRMNPDWSEMLRLRGRNFLPDTESPNNTWLQQYIFPEDQPRVMAAINQAVQSRGVFTLEHRVQRVDGSVGWVFARAIPLLDANGNIEEWFGAASDITERKRVESERDYAAAMLQAAIECLPFCFFAVDKNGRYMLQNEASRRDYGDAIGRTLDEVCPNQEDLSCWLDNNRRALAGERVEKEATYNIRGQARDFYVVVAPVQDAKQSYGILGINVDITDRKIAEKAMRAESDLMRTTMQCMAEGICVWHEVPEYPHNRFTVWNNRMKQITGYSMDEINRQGWGLFMSAETDQSKTLSVCATRMLRGDSMRDEELELIRADGGCCYVQASGSVIWDCDGARHAILMIHDVTDKKLTEESLRESEQRQVEAEKMAATGRMAARVAHEINNPLAGIQNAFQLIRDAVPKNHPDYDMVERIDREIDRIASIVKQMYTLYSPRAERVDDIRVANTVRDVLAMLEPLRREHGVQFDARDVLPGLVVRMPEGGLQQTLYNLVTNAIEASAPGGVVAIAAQLSGEDSVELTIRDHGVGITAELSTKIFEPFFSAKADNSVHGGLGVGLCVVKGIVESVGGRIEFDSTPGQGTVFHVYLPRGLESRDK